MDSLFAITRSVLVIFIPGAVALAPWLLLLVMSYPQLAELYAKYPLPYHASAFTAVILLGTLIEGCMSYLEKHWDGIAAADDEPDGEENWVERDWHDYLAFRLGDKEPVGYRYLSRKVTELYFCLAMMVAAPVSIVGFGALADAHGAARCTVFGFIPAACIAIYLFRKFAIDTHCLVYNVRFAVMKRLRSKLQTAETR